MGATIVVTLFHLDQTAGVKVLGPLPQGLPSFALPMLSLADLRNVLIGGGAVSLVSFAYTSVLSRVYAAKLRTPTNPVASRNTLILPQYV